MKVLVDISHFWIDESAIRYELAQLPLFTEIVHRGTGPRFKTLINIAEDLNLEVVSFVDISGLTTSSDLELNTKMIDDDVDLCVVFSLPSCELTRDLARKCGAAGIEIKKIVQK